jgi:hypothetical protein
MEVLRRGDHAEMPWRNGGGTTWEVARSPRDGDLDAFDWRVSFARVGTDGPFSSFAGVDRVITLVSGGGMRLALDGGGEPPAVRDLVPFEPFAFAGEREVHGTVTAPTMDLNVMTRRGRCSADVRTQTLAADAHWDLAAQEDGSAVLVVVLEGTPSVTAEAGEAVSLASLDVVVDLDRGVRFSGPGVLVVVTIVSLPVP